MFATLCTMSRGDHRRFLSRLPEFRPLDGVMGPPCFFAFIIVFFSFLRSFHTSTNPPATHQQFRAFFRIRTGVEGGKLVPISVPYGKPGAGGVRSYSFRHSSSCLVAPCDLSLGFFLLSRWYLFGLGLGIWNFGSRSVLVFGFSDGLGKGFAERKGRGPWPG